MTGLSKKTSHELVFYIFSSSSDWEKKFNGSLHLFRIIQYNLKKNYVKNSQFYYISLFYFSNLFILLSKFDDQHSNKIAERLINYIPEIILANPRRRYFAWIRNHGRRSIDQFRPTVSINRYHRIASREIRMFGYLLILACKAIETDRNSVIDTRHCNCKTSADTSLVYSFQMSSKL